MTNLIQRSGHDHDPVKLWQWATLPLYGPPVEIVSYPCPPEVPTGQIDRHGFDFGCTIMVRMTVGDPTSIREVSFRHTACFEPDRHEWYGRPRRYYGDNPTAFHFADGGE